MIKAQFKFAKTPPNVTIVDTTSSSGDFRDLSPFILPAPPALRFENLWQFSKVYKHHWDENLSTPNDDWYKWRDKGYNDLRAHRYPMGKGRVPVCSWWEGRALGYIEARKLIYVPEYAKNVVKTDSFSRLVDLYVEKKDIVLLDYDAYDHEARGMTLVDVINDPDHKMGHAFVLIMILTSVLEECMGVDIR